MKQIELFKTSLNKEPFKDWLDRLDKRSQIKVLVYVERLVVSSSKKNIKPLGEGVNELKIDFGPVYRVYFAEKNNLIILLLLGGDKDSQQRDILKAKIYWRSANVS